MKSKVFIHHDGALGDVLLSLPAINLIHKTSSSLHLAAKSEIALLFKQLGIAEDISEPESALYLPLYTGCLDTRLRNFLSRFEKAFVFTSRNNSLFTDSLKTILPDTKIIKTIPPENSNIHVSEFRIRQLEGMAEISCNAKDEKANIPLVWLKEAHQLLINSGYFRESPLISIHPGSGGARKCWKLENYLELAKILSEDYKSFVIIFSGPAESDADKTAINNFINGKRNIIHISMNELILVSALLNFSDLYIGNDSGISHLASLFCKNVIVIFGPTNPILWRPAGDNVIVITSEQRCAPCSETISINCSDRKCLIDIQISKIIEKIDKKTDLNNENRFGRLSLSQKTYQDNKA